MILLISTSELICGMEFRWASLPRFGIVYLRRFVSVSLLCCPSVSKFDTLRGTSWCIQVHVLNSLKDTYATGTSWCALFQVDVAVLTFDFYCVDTNENIRYKKNTMWWNFANCPHKLSQYSKMSYMKRQIEPAFSRHHYHHPTQSYIIAHQMLNTRFLISWLI